MDTRELLLHCRKDYSTFDKADISILPEEEITHDNLDSQIPSDNNSDTSDRTFKMFTLQDEAHREYVSESLDVRRHRISTLDYEPNYVTKDQANGNSLYIASSRQKQSCSRITNKGYHYKTRKTNTGEALPTVGTLPIEAKNASVVTHLGEGIDEHFPEAGRIIIEKHKASIGLLQRAFKIGFNRAARIMDQLADAGVVTEESNVRARQVIMSIQQFEDLLRAGYADQRAADTLKTAYTNNHIQEDITEDSLKPSSTTGEKPCLKKEEYTMADQKKLDRWAEKLLDTGKRNNLISFKDTKASSAELVFPNCDEVFSKCSIGYKFEVFDPKIQDEEIDEEINVETGESPASNNKKLSRREYIDTYSRFVKGDRLLIYAQTPNPLAAVKNISKKAKQMSDETGINVAYLAFGFLKWNEKEGSDIFYRAPLLLVHTEIITGGILDPISIVISDDDIVVNPTFDYLIQAEYGMNLPQINDGESLLSYLRRVDSTFSKMGWEVINECKLGVFSFQKINMYEDLKKNAQLILENANIKALLGEPISGATGFSAEDITIENPLIELHTVVDADSSQIEAIEMAKSGKSFVLQGPPGTGKSQTITNIIAECLHDGKKVLFVSEKQAALNVVYDKLRKADLSDFCLELHSHKANKKAVIDELNRTLEVPRITVSSSAQEEIRQKQAAQKKLDEYAYALHKKRDCINKSLYQLFELFSSQRQYPEVEFSISNLSSKGQDYLLQAVKLLEQYAEYVPSIGEDFRNNPWYGLKVSSISYDERNQLKADLEQLSSGYRSLQDTTTRIRAKYETPELNFADTLRWKSLLSFSAESDVVTPAALSRDIYTKSFPVVEKLRIISQKLLPIKENYLSSFLPNALDEVDGKELLLKLNGQFSSIFSRLFNGEYKNLIATIQMFIKDGNKPSYQQAVDFATRLYALQDVIKEYEDIEASIKGFLGSGYKGPESDWDHIIASLQKVETYHLEESTSFGRLPNLSTNEFAELQKDFQTDAGELSEEINSIEDAKSRLKDMFLPDILDLESHSYNYCLKKIDGCLHDFDKLANWISFMDLLQKLDEMELSGYVGLVINRHIEPEKVVGTFRRLFYKQWIEYTIFSVPALASFTRINQDQAVLKFGEKDNLQYAISKEQIKAELSQQRPNLNMVAGGSAVAILRREGNKKRKQMPIRRLLSEISGLVQIIKPCFLMSPLSVSTFLDPEKISFDTVVFDEASQIFPQDAIGAIYRGKQIIVVGDSKQMPPSNFFNASTDIDYEDEEDYSDITDFESILDICSAVFNTERLAWHYRSHYEQLIAFSNLNFYNNHLVTFPSSTKDHKGIGVDYYYVDGIFDRKSKTNRGEAEFIVELIYRHFEEHPERSLGVVAFSVAQQNLIDRLLSKKREEDPSYEEFFKNDVAEPFFIKNLETVQGDERDTIIFSVAYARDAQGRFIHNFGPLNRAGGERRLNVAITRAKDNVQLVASIRYTDINLSNSGSEGVRLLRAYLDYAQNGEQALERTLNVPEEGHFDSYFEQEVCDFLRDQGFTVDTQVGCSGYKIDLGVRKPDSSQYVLAVECDGATYHSSRNARDRDSLRQRVLENMGWVFYRIWSTDWFRNKVVEKERLLQATREALKKAELSEEYTSSSNMHTKSERTDQTVQERFVSEVQESKHDFQKYTQVNALQIIRDSKYWFDFQGAVRKIIEEEGPISEEFLLKRIVFFFGKSKVTKTVIRDFDQKLYGCRGKGIIRKDGFLYTQDMDEIKLHVPGDKREIKYISLEELADGLCALIQQNVVVSKESLYKSLTSLLGYSRTGEAITSRYDRALSLLIANGSIVEQEGLLSLG